MRRNDETIEQISIIFFSGIKFKSIKGIVISSFSLVSKKIMNKLMNIK